MPPEIRCNVCLKVDAVCVYTNPAPPQVPTSNAPSDQSHDRLDRLEAGLARLVGLLEPAQPLNAPAIAGWEMPLPEDINMPAFSEFPSIPEATFASAFEPPRQTVHFVSPGSQNTDKRLSATSSPAMHLAEARPLPRYRSNSRMDAFSPEAPFRSVTYNPDTYLNAEITDDRPLANGGKTPKRGKGDPLDLGVIEETLARQLFTL